MSPLQHGLCGGRAGGTNLRRHRFSASPGREFLSRPMAQRCFNPGMTDRGDQQGRSEADRRFPHGANGGKPGEHVRKHHELVHVRGVMAGRDGVSGRRSSNGCEFVVVG